MECTLAALLACFSWSGFYIDTGIEAQDAQTERHYTQVDMMFVGQTYQPGEVHSYTTKRNGNPYGRFGIGYDITVGRFTWSLDALHTSSLSTSEDRGVNSISLNVRWRPFSN